MTGHEQEPAFEAAPGDRKFDPSDQELFALKARVVGLYEQVHAEYDTNFQEFAAQFSPDAMEALTFIQDAMSDESSKEEPDETAQSDFPEYPIFTFQAPIITPDGRAEMVLSKVHNGEESDIYFATVSFAGNADGDNSTYAMDLQFMHFPDDPERLEGFSFDTKTADTHHVDPETGFLKSSIRKTLSRDDFDSEEEYLKAVVDEGLKAKEHASSYGALDFTRDHFQTLNACVRLIEPKDLVEVHI